MTTDDADNKAVTNPKYSAPAAACAADLLRFLARSGEPCSLADIARGISRNKSLVFRVVRELQQRELVVMGTDDRFRLGIEALELGGAYVSQSDYYSSMRHELRELSRATGETVNLGVLRDSDVLYVMKEEGAHSIVSVSQVGRRIPAHCSALGKALLAELTNEQVRLRVIDPLVTLTEKTIPSVSDLEANLDRVRELGYAIDDEETISGRVCVGVAVRLLNGSSDEAAAISVSTSRERFESSSEELLTSLRQSRDRLQREIAGRENMGLKTT